jgi:hypothetical protein
MNIHKNSVSKSLVPTNQKCNDLDFGELIKGKKIKRVRHIIWLATTWCTWRACNNILFRGVIFNVFSLVLIIYDV